MSDDNPNRFGARNAWRTVAGIGSDAEDAGFSTLVAIPYWSLLPILLFPELRNGIKRLYADASGSVPKHQSRNSALERDSPCVQCGYNLRMLPITGQCPECGTPVASTLTLNTELAQSRPKWLRGLAIGSIFLLGTRLALLVPFFILLSNPFEDFSTIGMAVWAMASILYAFGIFLLTRKEHPFVLRPDRKIIAFQLAFSWAGCLCTETGVGLQQYPIKNIGGWLWRHADACATILILVGWLAWCGGVSYSNLGILARLAARLIDNFMTEHCIIAGIGAAATNVLFVFAVPALTNVLGFPIENVQMAILAGLGSPVAAFPSLVRFHELLLRDPIQAAVAIGRAALGGARSPACRALKHRCDGHFPVCA